MPRRNLKKKMVVAGIDYSLNGPCICVYQGDGTLITNNARSTS